MASSQTAAPADRNGFNIAIICALTLESNAVEALFDQFYEDEDRHYGRALGDTNAYTLGRIGRHNVVLAYMPGMGQIHSTAVAAHFHASFPKIRLGLVVGIAGGAPVSPKGDQIFLGDILISTELIQTDFGRQYADQLVRKEETKDILGRQNIEIRNFLGQLQGWRASKAFRERITEYIDHVLSINDFRASDFPGAENDRLFASGYRHKHQEIGSCTTCNAGQVEKDPVCEAASSATCSALGCDNLVVRTRSSLAPQIFFGTLASSSAVTKSSVHRDEYSATNKVIGFEMEGAGVWDQMPTIVVKGVCDYSDSHKNKQWQPYAALTGAAAAKALLMAWRGVDGEGSAASAATSSNVQSIATREASRLSASGNTFSGPFEAKRDMYVGNTMNFGR